MKVMRDVPILTLSGLAGLLVGMALYWFHVPFLILVGIPLGRGRDQVCRDCGGRGTLALTKETPLRWGSNASGVVEVLAQQSLGPAKPLNVSSWR